MNERINEITMESASNVTLLILKSDFNYLKPFQSYAFPTA